MKLKNLILPSLGLAMLGCAPDLDFDKFSDIQYRGEWEVPVANASISLEDILVNDTLFTVDPDGGLRVIYESDSVFGFSIDDFASVPQQNPVVTTVPLDIPSLSVNSSLGTIGGAKFKSIRVRDGLLSLSVDNALSNTVELRVVINNADIAGTTFQVDIVAPVGSSTTTVPIAGLEMDMTNGGVTENYISFDIVVLNNGGAAPGESVDLELVYENLTLGNAVGYFGQRNVSVPSGNLNLGIEAFENFLNGLYLENPTIDLAVTTNVGLPLQLNLKMDGVNTAGQLSALGLSPISIPGPTTIGTYDTTHIIIDNTTSNIVDFISNVPNTILYSGSGEMNPAGETGIDNFITADGEMQVGVTIDLPLELRTQNLVFEQDIDDLDFSDLRQQDNPIEKLIMRFHVENEFPLDADLKVRFVTSTNQILDSISLDLFDAAPVDANGRSTGYTITTDEEVLTATKIDRLLNASKLQLIVTMNTSNNGNSVVKIYEDYDIAVKLGLNVKLKYDL